MVLILSSSLLFSGCAKMKSWLPSRPKKHKVAGDGTAAVTLTQDTGKIAKVNATFVVLTFPVGGIPPIGQKLNVYRKGAKIGEVKVTGPQRDTNTVADIISGELQVNDEVRAD